MNTAAYDHPLEEHVTDYINGKLEGDLLTAFESSLQTDAALQDIVAFERQIKSAVTAPLTNEFRVPRFASLEDRLGARRVSWLPSGGQWAVAAAVVLAVTIGLNTLYFSADELLQPDDSYRTLTDPSVSYEQPVLRIVLTSALSTDEQQTLLDDYNLSVVASFPAANTIDVEPLTPVALSDLVTAITSDDRVRWVKVVDEKP